MSQPLRPNIGIFVVESSPISSYLLAEAIARGSGIKVLGFGSNPTEVVPVIFACCPDVLVISARIGEETTGLSILRQVRSRRPGLKAVVLLDSCRPDLVVGAFRSGASGVFCRSTELHLLRKCITAVHNGQIWANSEELGFVLSALAALPASQLEGKRMAPLSTREKEVVRALVEGMTNKEIAATLAISEHTVKNYIYKIFDKLGVSNRVELVFQVLSGTLDFGPSQTKAPATVMPQRAAPAVTPNASRFQSTIEQRKGIIPQPPSLVHSENIAKAAS